MPLLQYPRHPRPCAAVFSCGIEIFDRQSTYPPHSLPHTKFANAVLSRSSRDASISLTSLSYPAKQYRFSLSFFIFRYRSSSGIMTAYRIAYCAIEKLSLYTFFAFSSKASYVSIRLRDLSSRYCAILTPLATTFAPAPAKSEISSDIVLLYLLSASYVAEISGEHRNTQ